MIEGIATWWMWAGFAVFVVVAIAVDLLALEKQGAHAVTTREALAWSLLWVSLALLFAGGLWLWLDHSAGRALANLKATEFLTGYLIEKSLSVDNIFVFLMLFTAFAVPAEQQKKALILGVIGAVALRAIMILIGAWLIAQFHAILYIFGAFLLITGIKMLVVAEHRDPEVRQSGYFYLVMTHVGTAFLVAASGFELCTQEQCSLMFAISKRNGFSPDSLSVCLNSSSWVRGVQDATTIRLSPYFSMASFTFSWLSWEQAYRNSPAYSTLFAPAMLSLTLVTSTTLPILMPQRHTKTPTLGSSPVVSLSGGKSFSTTLLPLAPARKAAADPAAALACTTVSGISCGPVTAPQTKIPSREDWVMSIPGILEKPWLFNSMPSTLASSTVPSAGLKATDSTTMSNSSVLTLPNSSA